MKPGLTLCGLGPAGLDLLPEITLGRLRGAQALLVRTSRHPAAEQLRQQGVQFEALDRFYEKAATHEEAYRGIARYVWQLSLEKSVTYATPGNPLVGEETVRLLLEYANDQNRPVDLLPAPGFVEAVMLALARKGLVPRWTEWQVLDAQALPSPGWRTGVPTLIFQLDHPGAASSVKLALQEEYPEESEVWIVRGAGMPGLESVLRLPLYQIDRPAAGIHDHLTCLVAPPLPESHRRPRFHDFVELVAALRSPEGCPWDRAQTPESLKRFVLEEAYEVVEAVSSGDSHAIQDELGDLMLQVLLYAQIYSEWGDFDVRDVIGGIVEKLIRRHPHVFAGAEAATPEQVTANWEAIKKEERPERASALDGIPKELPALMRALKVSRRAANAGFEWPDLPAVWSKLEEEIGELRAELQAADPGRLSAEIGDLLFTVVNIARWLKVDPEEALREMVHRFERRFRLMEQLCTAAGFASGSLPIEKLDEFWNEAKQRLETESGTAPSGPTE